MGLKEPSTLPLSGVRSNQLELIGPSLYKLSGDVNRTYDNSLKAVFYH